jgi:hypothetical protein
MKAAVVTERGVGQSHALNGGDLRCLETSPFSNFGEVSNMPLDEQTRSNPPIPSIGTKLAISKFILGVPALFTPVRAKGGARNHASRESYALSSAHVANLIAATAHANSIGLPFTRMITIHWGAAGIALAGIVKATGRFIDLMTKAIARHGSGTAWLWTHENGPRKGAHCHLLAHVPAALVSRLTGLQRGWLRIITGKPYRRGVIRSDPIGGRLGLETGNPDLHATNLDVALAYLLKGADPVAASRFALDRLEPGGRIIGKRCGTSQNIGAKARGGRT